MTSQERQLDVCSEGPARRHQLIFGAYAALRAGECFVLVNDHDPKRLYYQFAAEHAGQFSWDYLEEGPETWRVRIGRTAGTAPDSNGGTRAGLGPLRLVVYADFGCAWCYLASRRVDALAAAGVEVDWRAVEGDPRLPVTGRRLDSDERVAVKEKLSAVAELLLPGEELPWALPSLAPKTEAAVSGYAEAYVTGVAADVRRLLFAAYWVDGANIGDPEVLRTRLAGPILRGQSTAHPLRESGYAVSVSRGPITTSAWRRIRTWREEWIRLGTAALPTLVDDGGVPVTGEAALHRLKKEIIQVGAEVNLELPDPARYPAVPVRPSKEWVSRVGGTWAHAWMGQG